MKNLEERARWLRHHCKLVNHFEVETPRGKLEVRYYSLNDAEVYRVSSKDDVVVDISKGDRRLLKPFNPDWQDIKFGGF